MRYESVRDYVSAVSNNTINNVVLPVPLAADYIGKTPEYLYYLIRKGRLQSTVIVLESGRELMGLQIMALDHFTNNDI